MAVRFQVTIDCADPQRLVRFWAEALSYVVEPPPEGFAGWNAYWRSLGVPEEELDEAGDSGDSVVDPTGVGPRVFFQKVPEGKAVKNRVHLDLDIGGGLDVPPQVRDERVDAVAERLVAAGATRLRVLPRAGAHAIVMQDPEGNEFCLR